MQKGIRSFAYKSASCRFTAESCDLGCRDDTHNFKDSLVFHADVVTTLSRLAAAVAAAARVPVEQTEGP